MSDAWAVAICSVLFDLDVGQRIDSIYPEGALTEEEANDVAFHSFPDSMSMELHSKSSVKDSTFFFRIRRRSVLMPPDGKPPLHLGRVPSSRALMDRQDSGHYDTVESPYLYGFVFCRQRQDQKLRRGGEQRSVVVLSVQPYSSVLSPLSQFAGPLYFNQGAEALEEAYEDMQEWPPPVPGGRAILPVGELTIMANLPAAAMLPAPAPAEELSSYTPLQRVPSSDDRPPLIEGAFHEVEVFTPLRAVLDRAWVLWELTLLAEPLMVVAPTPGECSQAVAALISLISPLPFSADFRPYFTIHDEDFPRLASGQLPDNSNALPRLMGVTNLYFLKSLPAWPNVLSSGRRTMLQRSASEGGLPATPEVKSRLGSAMKAVRRRAAGAQILLTEHVEQLWMTGYRPLTRADYKLLARLLPIKEDDAPEKKARAAAANSAELRRHFGELTTAFLRPFAPYMSPEMPPEGDGPLPTQEPPLLPAFSHTAFLETLPAALQKELTDRFSGQSSCVAFYKRFIESPNFASWFERRRQAAWAWQEEAWAAGIEERGVVGVAAPNPHQQEIDLVSRFFELEQQLQSVSTDSEQGVKAAELLKQRLGSLFEGMPRDLQATMLSAPHRASLLQGVRTHEPTPGISVAVPAQRSSSPGSAFAMTPPTPQDGVRQALSFGPGGQVVATLNGAAALLEGHVSGT